MSIFEISKTLMYEIWYHYKKPKYQKNSKSATWIQIALLFILKINICMNTLQMVLKKDLIHPIIK